MNVEVVFALPERQWCLELELPAGATVQDALRLSRIAERSGYSDLDHLAVGVWGQVVSRDQRLQPGDRVEIYRPLKEDPREARRRLAESESRRRRRGKSRAEN